MKILIINTYDFGGAATACIRLHKGLLDIGVDSTLLLKQKTKQVNNSIVYPNKVINFRKRLLNKLIHITSRLKLFSLFYETDYRKLEFLNQRPSGLEYFSFLDSNYDITEIPAYKNADIIHLHWVADFLDWESFFLKNTKPLVWTLHDQNPFLGGEHYAERYLGIDSLGNPMARVKKEVELLMEQEILKRKRGLLDLVKNVSIVSPSKWILNSSNSSELFNMFTHFLIPYGIPTSIFKPLNMNFCREIIGLPKEKKIILFVADSVDNSRKGYIFLQRALELIDKKFAESIFLCTIGEKTELIDNNILIELGKIHDERLMSIVYSAADIFVIPSLEDNLPNTILESLCCGTPVIGFPTGGILDVIDEGVNGIICNETSVSGLVRGIANFLSGNLKFDRDSISKNAIKRFALENQAKEYNSLYKRILNNR
jgi:glycosyltransferase involved in cell wall biosynthesis